jgi:hypothetical protein
MAKSKEEKLAEKVYEAMNDRGFNPTLFGRHLVNGDLYNMDRLMRVVVEVVKQQANITDIMWEQGRTSESLLLASHIKEVVDLHVLEDNPY